MRSLVVRRVCVVWAGLSLLWACGTSDGGGTLPADAGGQQSVGCGGAICDSSNPCTTATCDPIANKCVYTPNTAACDDGNVCTQGDKCVAGVCTAGANTCVDAAVDGGVDAGKTDAGASDAGTVDAGLPDAGGDKLVAGAVVISEIHYNPWGDGEVTDVDGEWLEFYNPGDKPVDLSGATIHDNGKDKYNILGANTVVSAKGYLVFGVSADKTVNGGVTVDHVYGTSLNLMNVGADALILTKDGVVIDKVAWDTKAGWPFLNARSMSLRPDKLDATANDDPTAWCGAQTNLSSGDKGTPGQANDPCDYIDADHDGVPDDEDNCLDYGNPAQKDDDKNSKGDVCEGAAPQCGNLKVDPDEQCDDGNKKTGDGCSSYCLNETPVPVGAVIITEFMANPKSVTDDKGEWIELYNTSGQDVDLNGVILSVTIKSPYYQWLSAAKPLIIKAGGYLLLANNADGATNGGLVPDYVYSASFGINSKKATLALTSAGKVVDSVTYDSLTWPVGNGISVALDPTALNAKKNDALANWCGGQKPFGKGDLGSPGVVNPSCEGADKDADGDGVPDKFDNCVDDKNADQLDVDNDGFGEPCDNCPALTNKDQKDGNKDGVGDACEKPGCGNGLMDAGEECDDGNKDGGDGCTFACKKGAVLKSGDLIITELMVDPSAVKDEFGEWVEIFNPGGLPVDLAGLWLKDAKGGKQQIAPLAKVLLLEAGKYAIFGANGDVKLNGGVTVAWAWAGLTLPNGGGAFTIAAGKDDLDLVSYTPGMGGWPMVKTGSSLQLSTAKLGAVANDAGSAWCHPTSEYGDGDKGTPGLANEPCAGAQGVCGDGQLDKGEGCDDGNKNDGDGCSAKCLKEAPKLAEGDLVITELMIKSQAGSDNGEWFEVYNKTQQNIDLNGLVIATKGGNHTIDGKGQAVMVSANGYAVLGRSMDKAINHDTPVVYSYGSLALGNSSGQVSLLSGVVEIDKVSYTATMPWPGVNIAKSLQLMPAMLNHVANDVGTNWCVSKQPYGANGMSGSPGQANSCN